MTNSEFKAWFEGFTEAMDGAPTKKQWERICARVKEINGVAVTERVFVDRYWPNPTRWWLSGQHPYTVLNASLCDGRNGNVAFSTGASPAAREAAAAHFVPEAAMLALGKADAAALAA